VLTFPPDTRIVRMLNRIYRGTPTVASCGCGKPEEMVGLLETPFSGGRSLLQPDPSGIVSSPGAAVRCWHGKHFVSSFPASRENRRCLPSRRRPMVLHPYDYRAFTGLHLRFPHSVRVATGLSESYMPALPAPMGPAPSPFHCLWYDNSTSEVNSKFEFISPLDSATYKRQFYESLALSKRAIAGRKIGACGPMCAAAFCPPRRLRFIVTKVIPDS
jgi:hypothetical protein